MGALLRGAIHVTRLRAEGAELRVSTATPSHPSRSGEPLGRRTLQSAADVTLAASFALSPAPPTSDAVRIDEAELGLRTIRLGELVLGGPLEAQLTRIVIEAGHVSGELAAAPKAAHLGSSRVEGGLTVDGKLALVLSGSSDPEASPWRRLSGTIELSASAPELKMGGATALYRLHGARLQLQAALREGAPLPGSVGQLEIDGMSIELETSTLRAPSGAVLTASVKEPDGELQVQFKGPRLEWGPGDAAASSLENPRLELELRTSSEAPPGVFAGNGRLSATQAELTLAGMRWALQLEGTAEVQSLDLQQLSGRIVKGSLQARELRLQAEAGSWAKLGQAHLAIHRAAWTPQQGVSLAGPLRGSGEDAGVFLQLFDAAPALRWMLSSLIQQPFTFSSELEIAPSSLSLQRVQVGAGKITGGGAFQVRSDRRLAAFLLRRGALRIGVSVNGDAIALHPAASEDWLTHALVETRSGVDQ